MVDVTIPVGVATSIGPLPHTDPAEAAAFVLHHHPLLPAAPSLPNRSKVERRLAQAAWGIPGIGVMPDGSLELTHSDLDAESPFSDSEFAGEAFVSLRAFVAAVSEREGPIKLQLTGPVTLGIALQAAGIDATRAFAIARTAVVSRARALLDLVEARASEATPYVFVDEPGLRWCTDTDFPIDAESAVDLVSTVLATLEPRSVTGLRCSGEADWKLVLQAGPQVLAAPVDAGFLASAGSIALFLERGGWIAWGAVPSDRPVGTGPERMWRHMCGLWAELVQAGCDPVLIRTQAMITPTFGLGPHDVAQATRVLEWTGELAERLHDRATAALITAGS